MTFEELWKVIVDKNVNLSDEQITVTLNKEAFKKAIQLGFNQGMKHQLELDRYEDGVDGVDEPSSEPQAKAKPYDASNLFGKDTSNMFGNLFGDIFKAKGKK